MSKRYICIHAHFYQPPRENPWLEAIELQDSAYPYHDWNERITAECYAPNSASRILDGEQRIVKIVNNYEKVSFNFGPTLLSWLEEKAPRVYRGILAADEESRSRFSGHGSALAQAYNHLILPLANRRDKQTQIEWGIRDFERRFGRAPEGMWLPETAVDLETLECLVDRGIRFTVLSPYQAQRVRPLDSEARQTEGGQAWQDVEGGRIDPTMAYRQTLPSGRRISLFFYDGPISRAVAFEDLLQKGEYLAGRLAGAFSDARAHPQLVHIATDGETYGHHQVYGDMALAYALHHIETDQLARVTNYGEFLELHPPTQEVEIFENTAWSCAHGVERWRSNCGCNSGMHAGWHQEWRAPLRDALDWLRDALAPRFEQGGSQLLRDPWKARDAYIDVILDRSPENVEAFLAEHSTRPLNPEEKTRALKLLELQRHTLLMYTSCGWFFDELSGIETVQVIQYAGRALQLSNELFGDGLEAEFQQRLERAKSNIPEHRDGRLVYEKSVKPAVVDLHKVGAHYAVSSVFESYGRETRTHCYAITREDYRLFSSGKARLALGRANIVSEITGESAKVTFGVLHLGDHNVSGGVREYRGEEAYETLCREITAMFERGDFPELIRAVDTNFGAGIYTLKLLFRDEQRKILRIILESTMDEAEAAYRQLYENHAPLMRFMADLGMPQPRRLQAAAEFTLNAELRRAFEARQLDLEHVRARLAEASALGIPLHDASLEFALRRRIETIAEEFAEQPAELPLLEALETASVLAALLPFEVNLWAAQNIYYEVLLDRYGGFREKAEQGDAEAREWIQHFQQLGGLLRMRVEAGAPAAEPAAAHGQNPPAGGASTPEGRTKGGQARQTEGGQA